MFYMPYISWAVFAIICYRSSEYRRTAFILLVAFTINIALSPLYEYMAYNNLPDIVFIYGAIDIITAYMLVFYGSARKIDQALILVCAVMLNAVMLMDYYSSSIPVDLYYKLIFILNLTQIYLMRGGIYGGRVLDIYKGRSPNLRGDRSDIINSCDMEEVQEPRR